MLNDIVSIIAKKYPLVVPFLRGKAALAYCETKVLERDPDEPGRAEKIKTERRIIQIINARFQRQLAEIQRQLEEQYGQKAINIGGIVIEDDNEEYAALVKALYEALLMGTSLVEAETLVYLSDGAVNERALATARTYVTGWLQLLDNTSRDAVRRAIETFVQKPGTTVGDMIDILIPQFGKARAERIAITETTRVYAQANNLYGQQLAIEYPEFKVYKKWFTNNDDKVCSICGPLHGKEVTQGNAFPSVIGGGFDNPPAHVNCRCWTAVTVKA